MRKTFLVNELVAGMVARYQQAHGIDNWSEAVSEMLIRGYLGWGGRDPLGGNDEAETALRQEWVAWKQNTFGIDDDPNISDDRDDSFERFLVQRSRPKWGGKRNGAGRKTDSE